MKGIKSIIKKIAYQSKTSFYPQKTNLSPIFLLDASDLSA